MTHRAPALFLSHGAPDLLLRDTEARAFLSDLGAQLPRPKAILVVSAHWSAPTVTVGTAESAQIIHDFFGFPDALYQYDYPAPGTPEIAGRVAEHLADQGIDVTTDIQRGLDHGAWSPLVLVYPKADLPVFQVSLQAGGDAKTHFVLGQTLEILRDEGVMIIGSGAATHNLGDLDPNHGPANPHNQAFERWLVERVESQDTDALVGFEKQGPETARIHPTSEHFLPLLVALGAAGEGARPQTLHRSFDYGNIAMSSFAWDLH